MLAKIYQPSRSAMQSGQAKTRDWVLEFVPGDAKWIDPLMGWTGSHDMRQQLCLEFDSAEDAVAYATSHGIPHQVFEPHMPTIKPKSYADNFRFDRKVPWSH